MRLSVPRRRFLVVLPRDLARLPVPLRPYEIEQRLAAHLGERVSLSLSVSSTFFVTVLPSFYSVRVRISPLFLYAPPVVLDALARHAERPLDLAAHEVLEAFVREHASLLGPTTLFREERPGAGTAITSRGGRGRCFDLEEIRDELNARFFERKVAARISWSRGEAQKRRRSILFGTYWRPPGEDVGQIKIHPALDQEWVPRGFVEFVVHHEMLHAVIPTRCENGRRSFHPPEFRKRERTYPGYHEWRRWERENLGRFLGKLGPR